MVRNHHVTAQDVENLRNIDINGGIKFGDWVPTPLEPGDGIISNISHARYSRIGILLNIDAQFRFTVPNNAVGFQRDINASSIFTIPSGHTIRGSSSGQSLLLNFSSEAGNIPTENIHCTIIMLAGRLVVGDPLFPVLRLVNHSTPSHPDLRQINMNINITHNINIVPI